jgi:hypothetical protein
VSLF